MEEVSIGSAVDKLEADTQRTRNEGLDGRRRPQKYRISLTIDPDLRRILNQSKNSPRLQSLKDEGFHKVFESIFRIVKAQRQLYITRKERSKTAASSRLTAAASALRLAVDIGASRVKPRTACAVLDHIIEALPLRDDGLCIPLQSDYFKSFRALLNVPSHGEHFKPKQWQKFTDFLLECLSFELEPVQTLSQDGSLRDSLTEIRNGQNLSLRTSQTSLSKTSRSSEAGFVDEIIISLKLLASISNAPLLSRANTIAQHLTLFLQTATRSQETAFECLNHVMLLLRTENMALLRDTFSALVPSIRRLWATKSLALREQMLATLSLCEDLLLQPSSAVWSCEEHLIEGLYETITYDAKRRGDREALNVDDLSFARLVTHTTLLAVQSFRPVPVLPRALVAWMNVRLMASLTVALDCRGQSARAENPDLAGPRKRTKLTSHLEELLQCVTDGQGPERLQALQILTLLPQRSRVDDQRWFNTISSLSETTTDEDVNIICWTHLLLAELASFNPQMCPSQTWQRVFVLACKGLSSSALSRTAAHLLSSLLQAGAIAVSFIDNMIAMFPESTAGPNGFSDATITLWTTLLRQCPSSMAKTSATLVRKCLAWLASSWSLASDLDRFRNVQMASQAKSETLLDLFSAVLGLESKLLVQELDVITSPLYRFWFAAQSSSALHSYLTGHVALPKAITSNEERLSPQFGQSMSSASGLVFEMLSHKITAFQQAWQILTGERSSNYSDDLIEIMATLCMVSMTLSIKIESTNDAQQHTLRKSVSECWDMICSFISSLEKPYNHKSLDIMALSALRVRPTETADYVRLAKAREPLLQRLRGPMQTQLEGSQSQGQFDSDPMDFMDDFTPRSKEKTSENFEVDNARHSLSYLYDPSTFHSHLFISLTLDLSTARQHDGSRLGFDGDVVQLVQSLTSRQIVAARLPLEMRLLHAPVLEQTNACLLLQKLAQSCLQHDDYERCEAALCLCLEVLSCMARMWVLSDSELGAIGTDIYEWFIKLMDRRVVSTNVALRMTQLLEDVFDLNQEFGSNTFLPSPRTQLLQMLKRSSNLTRFTVGSHISKFFKRFVLTEHGPILDDIMDHLPNDAGKLEDMVVRIYVLERLASTWHTVRRIAIYTLFETAARISTLIPHVTQSLERIAHAVRVPSARALLTLFAPQLFYTWLETETIDSLPFRIFGFATLDEMVRCFETELVGQAAMRSNAKVSERLSEILATSWPQLLSRSFETVESYSIAKDISIPRDEVNTKSSESFIRKELGGDNYIKMVTRDFPNILAILFKTMGDDQGLERSFERNANFTTAKRIYVAICSRGKSNVVVESVAQQPCFRAKYLVDELEFICKRIGLDVSHMISSATLIYVARQLFDGGAPALGPLHATLILRKLRALVCLAGPRALSDYPLEMLLHNLQPYLTQFHCSDDAIGLFWYLIEEGSVYLKHRLPFLAGLGVRTFAELSKFMKSEQDSNTQGSEFKSTMSKGLQFHGWLKGHLSQSMWTSDMTPDPDFYRLCNLAAAIRKHGSGILGTKEGDLILTLIQDQAHEKPLLSTSIFKTVMDVLCADFDIPSATDTDILDEIRDTKTMMQLSQILMPFLHREQSGAHFRKWIVMSLGRTYRAVGPSPHPSSKYDGGQHRQSISDSYGCIFQSLENLLRRHDSLHAGLAENTMQTISSNLSATDRLSTFGDAIDQDLMTSLAFTDFPCPIMKASDQYPALVTLTDITQTPECAEWASKLAQYVCQNVHNDIVLPSLLPILQENPQLGMQVLSSVIHVALQLEFASDRKLYQGLSAVLASVLPNDHPAYRQHVCIVVQVLLYLRQMPVPGETNIADRNAWLEVDQSSAAPPALRCGMPSASLLFVESQVSLQSLHHSRSSRRSSAADSVDLAIQTMPAITKEVDDPDFFYGYQEEPSLLSVSNRFAHEGYDYKSIAFQSALYDSRISGLTTDPSQMSKVGLITALKSANLQGIATAVQNWHEVASDESVSYGDGDFSTNLSEWKLSPADALISFELLTARMMERLQSASDHTTVEHIINSVSSEIALQVLASNQSSLQSLTAMAVVSEAQDILNLTSFESLESHCRRFDGMWWNKNENFDSVSPILEGREKLLQILRTNESLRAIGHVTVREAQVLEARTLISSLKRARDYHEGQFCLNRAVHLRKLSEAAVIDGPRFDAVANYLLAQTLWDQGEVSVSIQMLQNLSSRSDLGKQSIPVSMVEIFADLSHQMAEARLEKPDQLIRNYLHPAIKALKGSTEGNEAGRVFHNFATYCDRQLQNSDDLDEFARVESIRQRKEQEVLELEKMYHKASGKQRETLKSHHHKARVWFKLDDEEYKRLRADREAFFQQALKYYLMALKACDSYANDVLRFLALWLDQSDSETANATVAKFIAPVPSRKFAPLMNQLSSRVLDQQDSFQRVLVDLLYRICSEHPFHSLYQIFATSKMKGAENDEVARSRYDAARKMGDRVMKSPVAQLWISLHNNSISFVRFANEKVQDKRAKPGGKLPLSDIRSGAILDQTVRDAHAKVPPPTMHIELRTDKDYSSVPTLLHFDSQFSIAGGMSVPKIVTAIASDGSRHKMLVKGGNDDLRQDSIMEQVFEQVSNLLKDHRETRKRKLGIRTYRVLPLTYNAGIIEFVKDTTPLHEYLLPAHQRYFPKDYKHTRCRKEISDAQSKPLAQRIQAYKTVCEHFHPVMRFFFMEHFLDPEVWFQKRLNYSRSTAAISILGHVLGLGDRHGHNILLDEKTGEVVHIDLGVAFEAGRVLPVPEVVPFRLTRDLVDGMGLTGVEGVFRRCCNFTLEALRRDQDSIMTILDVLRYDPLYSWSVSPLRLARMQEDQDAIAAADETVAAGTAAPSTATSVRSGALGTKRNQNEPSEADRALTVVAKKLGKSLSVEATVNELIQQATDEKNLASLYCGWAAYA